MDFKYEKKKKQLKFVAFRHQTILSQGEMKTPHSFIWLDQGGGKVGGAWVFA